MANRKFKSPLVSLGWDKYKFLYKYSLSPKIFLPGIGAPSLHPKFFPTKKGWLQAHLTYVLACRIYMVTGTKDWKIQHIQGFCMCVSLCYPFSVMPLTFTVENYFLKLLEYEIIRIHDFCVDISLQTLPYVNFRWSAQHYVRVFYVVQPCIYVKFRATQLHSTRIFFFFFWRECHH